MPQTWEVTAPDGTVLEVDGDTQPTEQDLTQIFEAHKAQGGSTDSPSPGSPGEGDTLDQMLGYLPAAGGLAGGMAGGGLMSIPLAALGGVAGRGLETAIRTLRQGKLQPESASLGSGVKDLGSTGLEQGAYEAGGMGLMAGASKVFKPVGRFLTQQAVRPTQALMKEFPDVIDTIMSHRLPATARGVTKATAARAGSAATTARELEGATRAGFKIDPTQLLGGVGEMRTKLSNKPIADKTLAKIDQMLGQYTKEHTTPIFAPMQAAASMGDQMAGTGTRTVMGEASRVPKLLTPVEAKAMKTVGQAEGSNVLKAERSGQFVPTSRSLEARFDRNIAGDTRAALEQIPEYGPRIAKSEKTTQSLIGAEKALKDVQTRPFTIDPRDPRNIAALAVGGGSLAASDPKSALENMLATRALMSPSVLSHLVLAASSAPTRGLVRNLPRGVGLLSSH